MNYPESQQILEEIKKANKVLLNCHRGPDPDSIGSNLSLKAVLEGMGKVVDVICPSSVISKQTDYLRDYSSIKLGIDFSTFRFNDYDILVSLDSPNLELMTGKDNSKAPEIKTIVVDHHFISTIKGDIELRDNNATSVGEMLYRIFEDWGVEIDKNVAECLMTSIVGDTGAFAYPNTTPETFRIVAGLIEKGVDKDMIIKRIYRSEDFEMLKFWSEILALLQFDRARHFVWAMVPYEVYKKYEHLDDAKAKSASLFTPIVDGTDFGFIGVEEKPDYITISFRGRTDEFDTSVIAKELGGGGHKIASAAKLEGLTFEEATEKVLSACRKHAAKN